MTVAGAEGPPRGPTGGTPPGAAAQADPAGHLLAGARCASCGATSFPPLPSCPTCGGEAAPVALSGQATLFSFTVVRRPAIEPGGPFVLAWLRLDEGPLLTARLAGDPPGELHIGDPVLVICVEGAPARYWFVRR